MIDERAITDEAARAAAIDPARSILLQAPAGSGKTTVLAQRFLALLATVDEPEQVLAITFTRKAAAEMRERVLRALRGELDSQPGTGPLWAGLRGAVLDHAGTAGWVLEELPGRLRIQTIDSFNHEIARAMPVLGRFQPSLQVVDDAAALYLEAARRTLRALDAEPELAAAGDLLLRRLDNSSGRASALLASLLGARARWLPGIVQEDPLLLSARVEASLQRIAADALRWLADLPQDLLAEAAELARITSRHREAAGHAPGAWSHWLSPAARLDESLSQLPAWRAVVAFALTSGGTVRKQVTVALGFPPGPQNRELKQRHAAWGARLAAHPLALQRLNELAVMPDPVLQQQEHEAFAALARVLLRAVAELQLVFSERDRVDHVEVAATARQALVQEGAVTEQAMRHMLRIRHILVDEFQDVSPDQVHLLETLTADWSPGDGRSLFLVGDPMQSIYLFRNSEVGLFLRVRDRGIGQVRLEPLQLTRNFRSRAPLVEWANRTFAGAFPAFEDARRSAVGFLPSAAAREADPRSGVTVWALAPESAEQEEASRIAAEIEALRREGHQRIAILLRNRSLAEPILGALHRRGIPVLGVDLAPLASHAAVQDLVALASALLHAADRTAWLAVLRAPYCGLLLADLQTLCAADPDALLVDRILDPAVLASLSPDARQRFARCGPVLAQAWRARGSEPLDTATRRLWQRLGGPACCRDIAERLAAEQFLLALRALPDTQPQVDGEALAALAARLRDARPPGSEGQGKAVEVLTIHHSKGLEWDVVFLPGLGRQPRHDTAPLMRWLELPAAAGDDLLMSVHSIGDADTREPLGRFIGVLQSERQRNEIARLAYVAATRARERLYLSGAAGANGPARGSLLARFWGTVSTSFEGLSATEQDAAPEGPPHRRTAPAWARVPADFDPAAGLPPLAGSGGDAAPQAIASPLEFEWVGPAARAAGTVVHEELERLARNASLDSADFASRRATWQRRLVELGMPPADAEYAATQVASRMQGLRADPVARWLLATPHEEAHSELRLSGFLDGRLQEAVIDRCFLDAAGDRWVVDYKTGTHSGGGLEQFLAEEVERYRPQLARYRALASRLGPQPVRTALYFPWLNVLREVSG